LLGDRRVARIGYGAMQLESSDPADARAILWHAVERGVNHIDTAQFYGDGTANRHLRAALSPFEDDLVIATKVGADRRDNELVAAQRPEELRAQVDANLASLGVDRLDLVNLRRLDAPPGLSADGDQFVDLADQLAELIALRDAGKIEALGLSNVGIDQVEAALPAGIVCVQNAYNLLDRSAERVLDLCRDRGLAWVPFFPLGSAFERYASVTDDPAVIEVARANEISPAQVGLAWLLAHYDRALLIPGTSSIAHLDENLAAGDIVLDDTATAALDRRSVDAD
jgi:pyridoxine 4-dehydrogenase